MKQLAIIGSTGSIGTQTLDIVSRYPHKYRASVLVAANSVEKLIEQAIAFRPAIAIIANDAHYDKLRDALQPLGITTAAGADAINEAMHREDVDMVVTATVGYSGLAPTIQAIRAGKDIALANKETLVVAGELINKLLKDSKSKIYPVDSEHSAIFQCLSGEDISKVNKLIITASGGPFRNWTPEQIASATPQNALKHPNWSMGAKITIDSATLVNKAFEIIEAHWLFGIEPERIEAIIHPQSIIHSMVEFKDGAIKAQLGVPSMLLPIAYALGEADRLEGCEDFCDLLLNNNLTFEKPDTKRFPALSLAHKSLEKGGNFACVFNAANEIAVKAFLEEKISFPEIWNTIFKTLDLVDYIPNPDYEDYVESNKIARAIASSLINK